MNQSTSHTIRAALGAFLLCGTVALAQSTNPEAGLIGKRYFGGDYAYSHFSGASLDQANGAAALFNLPLRRSLDLTLAYSYAETEGLNFGAIDKAASASLLTHRPTEYGTGYFAATLGHRWERVTRAGPGVRGSGAFWGVRAGYEWAVGARTAVNLGVGYADAFNDADPRAQVLRVAAEANHWFSRDFAGLLGVAYQELRKSPNPITYTAGLRWSF